jgi:hypothetical protein
MATNPVHPPTAPATPPPADHKYDELSGVYGFFRRHQKKLLYTAGLFTLLTFSISGPMMSAASEVFGTKRSMPTILVNGQRVHLQPEDDMYGDELARKVKNALPPGVQPMLDPGEGGQLGSVYAILRRAAIEEGIEVSMAEVDRAIETFRERAGAVSAAKLATNIGFGSLAQYRAIVAEAMRIGTYIRLQTLALDGSDARVLKQIAADREKITLRVATFDEKKAEEDLKKEKTLSDEELQKYLDGKSERDKQMMGAYDPPRTELRFGALLLAEGQFDPEQWKDGALKDFTIGDDRLQPLYEQEKARFPTDKPGEFKPIDDPLVKTTLTRLIQAEEVMRKMIGDLHKQQGEAVKPLTEALVATQTEMGAADTAVRDADVKSAGKQTELAAKKAELEKKPDDAELKQQVETLETEATAAATELTAAKERATKAKDAMTAANDAIKAARATWDFRAAFAEATKDKTGFVTKEMDGMKSGEELKNLDTLGLDLGDWPLAPNYVPGLREKGSLAVVPGRTSKAVVLYQATNVDTRPLKPWDKLKPLAEGSYWTEQAKKLGEDKKKLMDDALLRLAKAAMKERVAELEGQKASRVDTKLAEWETKTKADIAAAEKELKRLPAGTQMQTRWQQELDAKNKQLEQKEQQRTLFDTLTQKDIEGEIATEAKKHYKDVLDAAAAEAGFTVADIGPHPRDLERTPRFDKNHDATDVYLMRTQSELKQDEATGVLHDPTNRRYHVAVCKTVEPLTAADVTRRDFESLRTGDGRTSFASLQAAISYGQAFTMKAVETRYDLQRPAGEQTEPQPAK